MRPGEESARSDAGKQTVWPVAVGGGLVDMCVHHKTIHEGHSNLANQIAAQTGLAQEEHEELTAHTGTCVECKRRAGKGELMHSLDSALPTGYRRKLDNSDRTPRRTFEPGKTRTKPFAPLRQSENAAERRVHTLYHGTANELQEDEHGEKVVPAGAHLHPDANTAWHHAIKHWNDNEETAFPRVYRVHMLHDEQGEHQPRSGGGLRLTKPTTGGEIEHDPTHQGHPEIKLEDEHGPILYHGTTHYHEAEDEDLNEHEPPHEITASGGQQTFGPGVHDPHYAYASRNPESAWTYAEERQRNLGGGTPHVYRVTPKKPKDLEEDPMYVNGQHRGVKSGDMRAKSGFDVLDEVPPSRKQHAENVENHRDEHHLDDWDEDDDEQRHYGSSTAAADHATFYHVTDNPNFELSTTHRPHLNLEDGGDEHRDPGIHMADQEGIQRWMGTGGYIRPYMVELHAHPGLDDHPDTEHGYARERYVPAQHYDKLKVHRVIPLDAFDREQGGYGHMEQSLGSEYDTGKHIPASHEDREYVPPTPYNGPDARDMTPEQHQHHQERYDRFMSDRISRQAAKYPIEYTRMTQNGYEDVKDEIEGPLYHGSRSKRLQPGDEITKGRKTNPWGDQGPKSQTVHFTVHHDTARDYADQAGGHVYEVEPTGEFKHDYSSGDFKTEHPLRVVRMVPRSEWEQSKTAAALSDDHPDKVYLRFGHWPKDERSQNNVTGWKEEGVSVYDLDHHGEPVDPDAGLNRYHEHDEHCEGDCDLDQWNDDYGNDTGEEMNGRVNRAETNRRRGREFAGDTGHLVKGKMVGVGHDGEPLLQNVKRVGDWIDHRHVFIPGAERHRLARDPYDEDYEHPKQNKTTRTAAMHNPHAKKGQADDEWYHGSPHDFDSFSDTGSSNDTEDHVNHWNVLLGNHFTATHNVAHDFSQGLHHATDESGNASDEPLGHVIHAKLHIKRPKVYASEHDMDQEVHEHEVAHGNLLDDHLPAQPHEDDSDEDWDDYHDQAGKERVYRGDSNGPFHKDERDPNVAYGFHPKATGWLNHHPDKEGIAARHKARLISQGHDGIVYGNEFERADGGGKEKSAIAFHPDQVEITQHHYGRTGQCLNPADCARQKRSPMPGQLELLTHTSARSHSTGRLAAPLPQECWDRFHGAPATDWPTAKDIEMTAMLKQAHDSGDGQRIFHCPFCGAGQVIARSDGTTECEFCHQAFTVQVQPQFNSFPQTDPTTGLPIMIPGMPGQIDAPGTPPGAPGGELPPGADEESGNPFAADSGDESAPDGPPGADDGDDGGDDDNKPDFLKGSSFRTAAGDLLTEDAYARHLALRFSANPEKMIELLRSGR